MGGAVPVLSPQAIRASLWSQRPEGKYRPLELKGPIKTTMNITGYECADDAMDALPDQGNSTPESLTGSDFPRDPLIRPETTSMTRSSPDEGGEALFLADNIQDHRDSSELADDSIRVYLTDIGRRSLLTSVEERTLTSKIEAAAYISRREAELRGLRSDPPKARQLVIQLLRGLCDAERTIGSLYRYLGIEGDRTVSEMMTHPRIRALKQLSQSAYSAKPLDFWE